MRCKQTYKNEIVRLKDTLGEKDDVIQQYEIKLQASEASAIKFRNELTTVAAACSKFETKLADKDRELKKKALLFDKKLKELKRNHASSERQLKDVIDTLNAHLKEVEKVHESDHRIYEKQLDEATERTARLLERCRANEKNAKSCRERSEKFARNAQVADEKLIVAEDNVNRLRSSISALNEKYRSSQNEVEKMRHDYGMKLEKSHNEITNLKAKLFHEEQLSKNAKAEMLHDAEISMIEHNEKHRKEVELLKESIRKADNENKVLKAKCDDLNDRYENAKSRYDRQVEKLQTQIRQHSKKTADLKAEYGSQILNIQKIVEQQEQEIDAKDRMMDDLSNDLRNTKHNIEQDSKTFEDQMLTTKKELLECKNKLHEEQRRAKLLERDLLEHKNLAQKHENESANQRKTIERYKTKLSERENELAQKDRKVGSTTAHNKGEDRMHHQPNTFTKESLGKYTIEETLTSGIEMQPELDPSEGQKELVKAPSLRQEPDSKCVGDVPILAHQDPSDIVPRSELDAARDQILGLKSLMQKLQSELKNKEKEIFDKNSLLQSLTTRSDALETGILKKEHLAGAELEKPPKPSVHAVELTKMQHEIDLLKSTLANKERSLRDYEEMMQKYQDEISVLRNVVVEKTNSIKNMENKMMIYNEKDAADKFHFRETEKPLNDKESSQVQTSNHVNIEDTTIAKTIACSKGMLQGEEKASASLVVAESSVTSAEGSSANLKFLHTALTQKENLLKDAVKKIEKLEKKIEMGSIQQVETNLSTLSDKNTDVFSGRTTKNMPTQTVSNDENTFNSPPIGSYLMTNALESIDLQQAKTYIQKLEDDIALMRKQYRSDLKQQAREIENLMNTVEGLQLSRSHEYQNRITISTFANLQKRNKELEDRLDSKSEEVSILKVQLQKLKFSKESSEKRLAHAHSQLSQFSTMVEESAKPTEILHDNLREMVDRIKLLEVEKKFMLSRMQEQALMIHRLSVDEEKREGLL